MNLDTAIELIEHPKYGSFLRDLEEDLAANDLAALKEDLAAFKAYQEKMNVARRMVRHALGWDALAVKAARVTARGE